LRNGIRGVKQNTTFTTNPLSRVLSLAGGTVLSGVVPATGRGVLLQKADEALLSEGSGPRVLDDEVVGVKSIIMSPTLQVDDVIDSLVFLGGASIENTALVVVPFGGVNVDGKGAGSNEGVHDGGLVVGSNGLEARELGDGGGLGVAIALSSFSVVGSVGIHPFLSHAIFDGILVGQLGDAAAAAAGATAVVGIGRAGHEFLLGEDEELACSDSVERFKTTV